MQFDADIKNEDFDAIMEKRAKPVLENFRKEAVSGISDPKLLKALQDVVAYWRDNFRPALASLCCEAIGGESVAANDVSLMMTLISAGGGIHDDVIDKSMNKHFRMTILGLHGLDYTLLVGDMLIVKGWAAARKLSSFCETKEIGEILKVFGEWTQDVCEAEFMEISCRRCLDTELSVYERILRKSMADTQACARLGGIMGGGSIVEVQALAGFGECLGYSFRLVDDLKDTLNIEGNLSNRLQFESVPFPILFAARSSPQRNGLIKSVLEKEVIVDSDLKLLMQACVESEAFDFILRVAKENVKEALDQLCLLKPSDARGLLAFMIKKSLGNIVELYRQFH